MIGETKKQKILLNLLPHWNKIKVQKRIVLIINLSLQKEYQIIQTKNITWMMIKVSMILLKIKKKE